MSKKKQDLQKSNKKLLTSKNIFAFASKQKKSRKQVIKFEKGKNLKEKNDLQSKKKSKEKYLKRTLKYNDGTNKMVRLKKYKQQRNPLPMKLRALPTSFWQQPNKTPNVLPSTLYVNLHSPQKWEQIGTANSIWNVNIKKKEIVSDANTDLLFSLFQSIEDRKTSERKYGLNFNTKVNHGKLNTKIIRNEDPYLTSGITQQQYTKKKCDNQQILKTVLVQGDSSSLSISNFTRNRNYAQILSQLVIQL